jgi:RHS repeat-associated protein
VTATHFGLDGLDAWAALNGSNALQTRYVRPDGVNALGAQEAGTGGALAWDLTDRQGSLRLVVNSAGTMTLDQIAYNAAGKITSESAPAFNALYGYDGTPEDRTTQYGYNDNRWYDTVTMRWTSRDPIRLRGGDANLYRPFGNAPTNVGDPTGLEGGSLASGMAALYAKAQEEADQAAAAERDAAWRSRLLPMADGYYAREYYDRVLNGRTNEEYENGIRSRVSALIANNEGAFKAQLTNWRDYEARRGELDALRRDRSLYYNDPWTYARFRAQEDRLRRYVPTTAEVAYAQARIDRDVAASGMPALSPGPGWDTYEERKREWEHQDWIRKHNNTSAMLAAAFGPEGGVPGYEGEVINISGEGSPLWMASGVAGAPPVFLPGEGRASEVPFEELEAARRTGPVPVGERFPGLRFAVDPAMMEKDQEAGVLRDGNYIKNPTARDLSDLVNRDTGKIVGPKFSGRYMYVVDAQGKVIIGKRAGQARMPHPTLIGGSNPLVRGAGIVDIRGGRVFSVDNASGHYKPGAGSLDAAQDAFNLLPGNASHRNFQGFLPFDR